MNQEIENLKLEMSLELTEHILPFWREHMTDEEFGGFKGQLDFYGQPVAMAKKGAVLNARILWTFASAYRHVPREEYLHMAHRAFDYIMENFIDPEFGGCYWALSHLGEPVESKKQIYALAFTIYGMTAYYMITGNEQALQTAIGLFQDIELHAFDKKRNGYVEAMSRDWKPVSDLRLSKKDQNENKTLNTHLHILGAYSSLFQVWQDDLLEAQLKNLIDLFLDKFVDSEVHLKLFFNDDWELKSNFISPGHDIECSWLLLEAAEVLGDTSIIEKCQTLAVSMARESLNGLDKDGALRYEYFPWEDKWDEDRHWWPQAEAVVAYFNAYQLSGDSKFLLACLNSWRFIKEFIVDRKNGEWHWSVDKNGHPNKTEEKAGFWKCPYHNSRACIEIIRR